MKRLLLAALLVVGAAKAAEGMWPLNLLPTQALREHGLEPRVALLQGATVQLPYGTGSFVSADGLVLTNHHVVSECIDALSSEREPLQQRGFVAATRRAERRCPGVEVQVLLGIDDVGALLPTDAAARRARIAMLEGAECPRGERCRVVALYGGAVQHRYRYRVWQDLRLVMAPEAQAANFGGDDDNFNYPRYAFDFALLRVYDADGRPHRPRHWLRPARQALREGDSLLVPGHPYRTDRLFTVAQLEAQRDHVLPEELAALDFELARLNAYAASGTEAERQVADLRATLENSRKAQRGALAALERPALLRLKAEEEARVRAAAASTAPWDAAARSAQAGARLARERIARELPAGSPLGLLVDLLSLREQRKLPAAQRLAAFTGAAEADLLPQLGADSRPYTALEAVRLRAHRDWATQRLGASHPWVQALAETPDLLSEGELLNGAARLRLLELDDNALAEMSRSEPMLRLALRLLPLRLALARQIEVEVQAPLAGQTEAIARARWQLLGRDSAPDATFTLRLSFGRATEVSSAGTRHPWQTNFGGLYARADAFGGKPPFDLAPRVAAARSRIGAAEPLNFIGTPDIVGGSSGSPVLNADHQWVGLAFDGNLDSLAGQYLYDAVSNRMVGVHQRAILLALTRIYPARHLARELGLMD